MKLFLFRRVCLCVAVLFSLCGMVVLVGRQQGEPAIIPELKPCGEMLCYLGILPGTTAWDEGMKLVTQTPHLKVSQVSDTLFLSTEPWYSMSLSPTKRGEADPNDGVVEEVKIDIDKVNIYAGSVIERFGFPCFVLSMSGGLGLGYPNALFVIISDSKWLTAESPISFILLHPPTTWPFCPDAQSIKPVGIYKWNGFRRYF